jgi:outer membrane protein OmpA-like peptidoglycan-associated protein
MEMKKQVLSFNEFVFEAYDSYSRIMEGEKAGAGALIEAISKLDGSGMSKEAKDELGIISGIAKAVATKADKETEQNLGEALLNFISGMTEEGVFITNMESKINVITYDNVVGESVLLENDERVKLLDWLYLLNLSNSQSKSSAGARKSYKGKILWNKVKTDKRLVGIGGMSPYIGNKKRGWGGKILNFLGAMIPFKKETNTMAGGSESKDTKYLADSGLLGNEVITAISSKVILTEESKITSRDMFLGGAQVKRAGAKDRRGLSNVKGDKSVVNGYSIAIPLDAKLTDAEMDPTSNKAKKVGEEKAHYTLVLYSMGDLRKSTRQIPFSDIVLTEKTVPTGENIATYTEDLLNNEDENKRVLFALDSSVLTPAGKDNINNLIESFYSIESVEIQGFASKEGDKDNNDKLCVQRAASVAAYIKSVKDWGIAASKVTSSATPNVQPKTSTETLPSWRKVRFIVKGTKAGTVPATQTVPVITPTIGKFTPDAVDIKQICLCFEVGAKKTSKKGK